MCAPTRRAMVICALFLFFASSLVYPHLFPRFHFFIFCISSFSGAVKWRWNFVFFLSPPNSAFFGACFLATLVCFRFPWGNSSGERNSPPISVFFCFFSLTSLVVVPPRHGDQRFLVDSSVLRYVKATTIQHPFLASVSGLAGCVLFFSHSCHCV